MTPNKPQMPDPTIPPLCVLCQKNPLMKKFNLAVRYCSECYRWLWQKAYDELA